MNPIIRTHTKENMSAVKEGKQEDTMCKETNCNTRTAWFGNDQDGGRLKRAD